MITSWFTQLDRATTIPQVVAVVRDYFATWTPAELARLPVQCRPPRVRDEEDIATLHATLVEEYRTSRSSGEDLDALQRLTSFVVRTSIRLAELGVSSSEQDGAPAGPERSAASRER